MKGCLGTIIGHRSIFPHSLPEKAREEVIEVLTREGIEVIVVASSETQSGAIENLKEAKRCVALFSKNRDKIEGILISLADFGDERAIADAIRMSGLSVPILIQAYPDELAKLEVETRRDSFCGKLSVCSTLKQYGVPFSLTKLHTLSPSSKDFISDLEWFMGVCRVVKGLSQARIGAIGARTTPFKTIRFSERLLKSGISVETVDLSEIIMTVERLKDSDRQVQDKLKILYSYSSPTNATRPALLTIAKLAIVLERWIKENEINACAIRCWPELQNYLGVFPCAAMSILNNDLLPCACETDVMGALAMYALQLASNRPSALFDWNNNYGSDRDKVVLFHCSNAPRSMLSNYCIEYNTMDARARGTSEFSYGTCGGRLVPGPMTFARVSTDETRGEIIAFVGEGEFINDPLRTFGGVGVAKIKRLQELLHIICQKGYGHHVAVSRSQVGQVLLEALQNYLTWDVYYHNQDYHRQTFF